jgi:exopolysaccharide biosynthesis polyprenyl glycosylphosphotransferase
LVGAGDALRAALDELEDHGDDVLVAVRPPDAPDLLQTARAASADVIVVACEDRRGVPSGALLACRLGGVDVVDAVSYVERSRRKVPIRLLRPAALIYDEGFRRSRVADGARRLISLLASAFLFACAAPVTLVVALAIRLDSRGPVLYRQQRVGRGGRRFTMWKFRTMHLDAEAGGRAIWAAERDPRVTRVGAFLRRTRLDELPQLLNVIAGDMDLVGPRPERPEFVDKLAHAIPFYELRTLLRPGLTGWAQIRYPYGASVEDARQKLGFDLYYVKHASPLLDLIVLFHTAKVVVTGRGAR